MAYAYQGEDIGNEASFLIAEYTRFQALSKIGFKFDGDLISDFKAEIFAFIGEEISRLEQKELKKKAKKRR